MGCRSRRAPRSSARSGRSCSATWRSARSRRSPTCARSRSCACPSCRRSCSARSTRRRRSRSAEGVALDVAEAREVLMKLVDTSGGGTGNSKSSMREDIIRKRRTEIDTIHGAVARLARRHKVATPTIDTMVAMVKGLQSQLSAAVRLTMDFALSDEQRLLVETARRFVRTELMPLEKELERDARARSRQRRARSSRSRRRSGSTRSTSRPNTAAAACRRSTPASPRSSSATRPTS